MTILIGLTGGIGAGKTTVARMLAEIGVAVVDADRVARELMKKGKSVYNEVVVHFGSSILCQDGSIDRAKLGAIVFKDRAERIALEGFTHQAIWNDMWDKYLALKAFGHCAVVFEVPLLIEAGLDSLVDEVWVVFCSYEKQLQRVMERGFTRDEAMARIAAQMPLAEKVKKAHRVVDTDTSIEATKAQVQGYYRNICGGGN
ncbi:MAG: Dephospho-CoA kinase [Firmicutes bacterium]|nr:Dephospho-CoA kinase [Bacillota bacterium]